MYLRELSTVLPAGRKFCKITQNRPQKKMFADENGRHFWGKAAEKQPKICFG
jgi:hypothetical protein